MALTTSEATLLAMLIGKATDVALQLYNKKTVLMTPEELDVAVADEEALTSELVDEFHAL
jgi:hypothetical protein